MPFIMDGKRCAGVLVRMLAGMRDYFVHIKQLSMVATTD